VAAGLGEVLRRANSCGEKAFHVGEKDWIGKAQGARANCGFIPRSGQCVRAGGGEGGHVAVGNEQTAFGGDDLGGAAGLRGDARFPVGHGFEVDETEALFLAGQGEDGAAGEFVAKLAVVDVAGELDGGVHAVFADEVLEAMDVVAAARTAGMAAMRWSMPL